MVAFCLPPGLSWLQRNPTVEERRGGGGVRPGPVADADHAGRQQVKAIEEALDPRPGAGHDRG
jgi:hypothetical protein